jgi:hypothetical protein
MIINPAKLFLCVLLVMCSCGQAGGASLTQNAEWQRLVVEEPVSPVKASAGDLVYNWQGANTEAAGVVVKRPVMTQHPYVVTLSPIAGDNGPALQAALAKVKAQKGGALQLRGGRYDIRSPVTLQGLSDVVINGPNAILNFMNWGDGLRIMNSERLVLQGVTIRYAKPALIFGTMTARGNAIELVLDGQDSAQPANMIVHQISSFDRTQKRYLPDSLRMMLGKRGKVFYRAPGHGYTAPELANIAPGTVLALKLAYYKGAAIRIVDEGNGSPSNDIVIDGITISNSAGVGIAVNDMGRGLAIIRSSIGPRATDAHPVGIAFDAIHITASGGDILIRDNYIQGSGDDAINIASPILDVNPGQGDHSVRLKWESGQVAPGSRFAFFDEKLRYIRTGSVVERQQRGSDGSALLWFDSPVNKGGNVRFARDLSRRSNRYAIINNDITRCECHGVLAQAPNGIIRVNRFTKTRFNAVRLLTSSNWQEGSGAYNVAVERNIVRDTGGDARRGLVWAAISVYGELVDTTNATGSIVSLDILNQTIRIADNDIADVDQGCISVASAARVTIRGNRCINVNRNVGLARLLIEPGPVSNSAQRAGSKIAYLGGGQSGIYVDPLSTIGIDTSNQQTN